MNAYVVASNSCIAILRAILPSDLLETSKLVAASEWSNLASKTRSLLVDRMKPAAVLVDTYMVNERAAREYVQSTEDLIRLVASRTPLAVIPLLPEIQAIFLEVPGLLEKWFGSEQARWVRAAGRAAPKEELQKALGADDESAALAEILARLDADDIDALRETKPLQKLIAFLRSAAPAPAKTATA